VIVDIPDGTDHASAAANDSERRTQLTRRSAVVALLQCGIVAQAFGCRQLAAGPFQTESQPLLAATGRLVDAMAFLGEPFSEAEKARLLAAGSQKTAGEVVAEVERVLDPYCLVSVRINPESRVSVERGAAPARLVEQGWRAFLMKVRNEASVTGVLNAESPQARPVYRPGTGSPLAPQSVLPADIADRWLVITNHGAKPMEPQLSGLLLEYRIVLLYSRDRGRREAQIGATIGTGTADIGFRNRTAVLFDIAPSRDVTLRVRDEHGRPTTASFVVQDKVGRVYPARSKRLAPDFFFQNQIYRADGETVRLPDGEFTVTCGRGPEYIPETRAVTIGSAAASLDFALRRWIDPASQHWYSGDHHIHAAGCSHYESPTEGVRPEDMMRHVLGEALSVASVLNWGPSYYHQRQFFEGKDNASSTPSTLIRYDLEISGFPSSHCGHLVLLRLRNQDYPDVRQIEDWPAWDLPILKWAKAQGAITGFAHSGNGLQVNSRELPNYEMPNFDGIGAQEYIVDVTHDVVDFISTADTPFVFELNIWYHTLNCGYRTRVSGETDFPCITDERVGGGRSYVHLPQGLTYDAWCDGVREGRSYVSDGFSHLMDFTVNGLEAGTRGSELTLERPGTVRASARVACLLPAVPVRASASGSPSVPVWSPEHARVAESRDVTVEVVVNGRPVATKRLTADGTLREMTFDVAIERSSWIALRILGSAHTNPIFIVVNNRPVRASRKSARWCLQAVDQCWSQKSRRFNAAVREAAQAAYDHARARYRQILSECEVE
jgi:hypothetical protein